MRSNKYELHWAILDNAVIYGKRKEPEMQYPEADQIIQKDNLSEITWNETKGMILTNCSCVKPLSIGQIYQKVIAKMWTLARLIFQTLFF